MKKSLFILFISISMSSTVSMGKNLSIKIDTINFIDSYGKKQGFWKETQYGLRSEMYFLNDMLNGVVKAYYQNNQLASIGLYANGKKTGDWLFFNEDGRLTYKEHNVQEGRYFKKIEGELRKFSYHSFIAFYYPDGHIKEEGFAIYNDVEENIIKIGQWKIYQPNGKILKIEMFENTEKK